MSSVTVSVVAAVEHSQEPASLVDHPAPSVASAVLPVGCYAVLATAQLETVEQYSVVTAVCEVDRQRVEVVFVVLVVGVVWSLVELKVGFVQL